MHTKSLPNDIAMLGNLAKQEILLSNRLTNQVDNFSKLENLFSARAYFHVRIQRIADCHAAASRSRAQEESHPVISFVCARQSARSSPSHARKVIRLVSFTGARQSARLPQPHKAICVSPILQARTTGLGPDGC